MVPVGVLLNSQRSLAGVLLPGSRIQADHLVGTDAHRVRNARYLRPALRMVTERYFVNTLDSKNGVGVEAFLMLT